MATNVNVGQSVWNADDLINPVAIIFCVVISVNCIYYTYIFDKYNMINMLMIFYSQRKQSKDV